ncbi:hypothetical protein GM418_23360 [Maribellus comscasis]|uniref:Uncharacterized protein n=1 Tax=Maribellus comscasis TaxID=2681766 RepID=A0A6I6K236_9BACT|nr:hypothetical protein [Maribellus comscasis]QGY46492.1 hypothetical protein GM418_23360 [Maribellus comscasis]
MTILFGILYSCPAGKRLPDYPVKGFDHLSPKEKFDFVDEIEKEELLSLLNYHYKCSKER